MAVQVITPQQESFDLHVSLPKEYLGRQVHCLFYIEEEAKSVAISPVPATKPSQKRCLILLEYSPKKKQTHSKSTLNELAKNGTELVN
jgi:hypothetical protein